MRENKSAAKPGSRAAPGSILAMATRARIEQKEKAREKRLALQAVAHRSEHRKDNDSNTHFGMGDSCSAISEFTLATRLNIMRAREGVGRRGGLRALSDKLCKEVDFVIAANPRKLMVNKKNMQRYALWSLQNSRSC